MEVLDYLSMSPWWVILNLLSLISTALLLLFMHFSSKHRNKSLSAAWYICGFLMPVITAVFFFSQRKKFPGPDTKVCYQCENKYPETFVMCTRCLIELPETDKQENAKNEKRAKYLGVGYLVTQIISIVGIVILMAMGISAVVDDFEDFTGSYRIGIENEEGKTVYYDKMGNSYDDPYAVVIYDKDGNTYTYTTEAGEYFEEYYYVSEQGDKYYTYECYVDADGNFYHDEDYEIYYDYGEEESTEETDTTMSDEEFFEEAMNSLYNYKYYEDPLTDGKGNYYYMAEEASWNEKGELITAENDPTVTEEVTE